MNTTSRYPLHQPHIQVTASGILKRHPLGTDQAQRCYGDYMGTGMKLRKLDFGK